MYREKVTINVLQEKKRNGEVITALTAYDAPTASLLEEAEIDMVIVGDSLGTAVLGYTDTRQVTMNDMIHHAEAVARGAETIFLVGDMPFVSYQGANQEIVHNAERFINEASMDCIKLEGGREVLDAIHSVVSVGIPVMGHVAYPRQNGSIDTKKTVEEKAQEARLFINLIEQFYNVGCFAIVLARVPLRIAKIISERLPLITIGIGSGPYCHGQVLVTHDMLGLSTQPTQEFNKRYLNLSPLMVENFVKFRQEVNKGHFPTSENSRDIDNDTFEALLAKLE